MPLEDVVNVQITRETLTVARAAFDVPLILGINANFPERVRSYSTSDLSGLAADIVGGTASREYLAAQALASQNPRITSFKVGHVAGTVTITENAGTHTAGSLVSIVNGSTVTTAYSVDKPGTWTAHAAAIAALAAVDTAVYNAGAHTLIITPNTGFVLGVTIDLTGITGTVTAAITTTATESLSAALTAIKASDNTWYAIINPVRTDVDNISIATWTEANKKIFFAASADPLIIASTDTASIAYDFHNRSLARSAAIHHLLAASQFADAALLGKILPYTPGSYTAKFKTLAGISADMLTTSQETNALAKAANIYTEVGGRNIVQAGSVGEGEWIDTIILVDWIEARIKEEVYSVLVNNLKVPYDDRGIAAIQAAISRPLDEAISNGGLTRIQFDPDTKLQIGGYVVNVPKASDISPTDKNLRQLRNVTFTAWLAGAIHAVTINGTVTV